jgi:hypothetical protein
LRLLFSTCREQILNQSRHRAALRNPNERPREHPDHLVKKPVALKRQRDQPRASRDGNPLDGAHGIGHLVPPVGSEAGKIMPSDKERRRLPKRRKIEFSRDEPRAANLERMKPRRIPNPIDVAFAAGVKARVKSVPATVNARHAHDAHRRGKIGIQRGEPDGRSAFPARHIDVGALFERVHARVRASAAVDADGDPGDFGESRLQRILHTAATGLALPAGETAAVVSHEEFEPFGGRGHGGRHMGMGRSRRLTPPAWPARRASLAG